MVPKMADVEKKGGNAGPDESKMGPNFLSNNTPSYVLLRFVNILPATARIIFATLLMTKTQEQACLSRIKPQRPEAKQV